MKKHSFFKSVLIFAITLVMVIGNTTLTAFADDNTITINPNGQEGLGGEERFQAYCIFNGDLGSEGGELVGLEWGHGVDSVKLVNAMKADETVMSDGKTFGEEFTTAWDEWQKTYSDEFTEPVFVARFLAYSKYFNDPIYADTFARLVANNLKPSNSTGTPGVGDGGTFNPYKSHVNVDHKWVIDVPHSGYYLVKDTYVSDPEDNKGDGAVSSYILEVIGKATVDLKATVPTVEKKVEGQDGYMTGTYNDLTYTLTGTVAENIGEYETYIYKFTDTLSAGLSAKTDDESLSVKVEWTPNSKAPSSIMSAPFARTTDYTVSLTPGTDNVSHTLTVEFNDLIASINRLVGIKPDLSDPEVAKSIKIIVTYKASLNEHAVMGSTGNPNDVKLEYSNNPYDEGTGETANDEVKTYTIALQILKLDDKGNTMQGVTFKLKNEEGKYATFKNTTENNEVCNTITGWVNSPGGDELVTDVNGIFNIHGLDVGKYTLEEISTKDDYELMKPVVFVITSTENGTGHVDASGNMGTITLTRDPSNKDRTDVTLNKTDFAHHDAQMTLTNYPSPILPHTGGIGAGIVIGVSSAVVILGVAVIAVALRKKKSE